MRRIIPVIAAVALAACGALPDSLATGGDLLVTNPLAGRFQTKVIPDTATSIGVLVTSEKDEPNHPAAFVMLTASDRQTIIKGLPLGKVTVTVAAFADGFVPVAANSGDADIIPASTGKRTSLELNLSTDPAVLANLAGALAKMKPTASPSPSDAKASPRPSVVPSDLPARPSVLPSGPIPSGLPSGLPSVLPSVLPSALASDNPLANLFGNTNIVDTFPGPELDLTKWIPQINGNPKPTLTVTNGLTVAMAPNTVPNGEAFARCEVITARMSAFDVQATTSYRLNAWPLAAGGSRIGLFTTGVALYRTMEAGQHVYVLERDGDGATARRVIPAPAPGGQEEMRVERRGPQLSAFAGPAGSPVLVGTVPAPIGFIPLTVGVRSLDSGVRGINATFRGAGFTILADPFQPQPSPRP